MLLSEGWSKVGPKVFCGFDVAAENDGVEAFFEPLFENDGGRVEFAIVLHVAKLLKTFGESLQLAALVFGPVSLFEDLRGGIVAFEAVVKVADGVFGFGVLENCCIGI